ncbi:MAG: B-box zinc finger protein [Acidobacteriota bacterium]|nr:B-box zinc finger protein [Acidobacteriota bacterium]
MNCTNHPEIPAVAYCRSCGKALCAECRRTALGTVYCEEHAPVTATPDFGVGPEPIVPATGRHLPSPGLAFLLGMIPGVGAIYNGQYAKGLIHAVVFGLLVSIIGSHSVRGWEPLFGILIAVWFFYMALEAYHTARKRRDGEPVDEFSSLIQMGHNSGKFPLGAVILIVLGVLLLLDTTGIITIDHLLRYWPVGLILLGVYMLYGRLETPPAEARHERR